jgi:hypothetical protein
MGVAGDPGCLCPVLWMPIDVFALLSHEGKRRRSGAILVH